MNMRNSVLDFISTKQRGGRLAMLTCYDYTMARLIDASGVDAVLVGDSLGCVMLGHPDTLPVTMEDMIHHARAVVRGCQQALVVVDMPFMSYQVSVAEALSNAGRIIKETGAQAVKLEGGATVVPQIRALVAAGIPVQAHVGMTPQSVNALGGFKVQGKGEEAAGKLLADALAVEEAGAFSVVLECVPPKLAALVTRALHIPTIGIGAGAGCDGQVLVSQDMLGMFTDFTPRFVKRFAEVGETMRAAFHAYAGEVKAGTFPTDAHAFVHADCDDAALARLERALRNRQAAADGGVDGPDAL